MVDRFRVKLISILAIIIWSCIFVYAVYGNSSKSGDETEMAAGIKRLMSVDYEVFGRVQGVFFRKYTQDTARKYGLVGWVKNTSQGTVQGTVQGQEDKIKLMKEWLERTGSPKSKIVKCEFKNTREITNLDYQSFEIDRPLGKKKKKSTS